mmetsp:Transcript_17809/g.17888  ORF Transcript_17809/g.17888 Transcript_17809/m.17888 type:complete len:137 (-) Transcript_17809:68-478(-)
MNHLITTFLPILLIFECAYAYHSYLFFARRQFLMKAASFDVTIIHDSKEIIIKVKESDHLLVAIEDHGKLNQVSSCRSGSCGVCACKVNDPSAIVHDDEDEIDYFKRKEGFIFSCCARVIKPGLVVELNKEDDYNV